MTRQEMKESAKQQLKGKWGIAIGALLVANLLMTGFTTSIPLIESNLGVSLSFNLLGLIFSSVMVIGVCNFCLKVAKNENIEFTDIFSGFKVFLKAMGLNILISLGVVLGTLLFIIPGIILAFMWSQANYILAEDNEKGVFQCLTESKNMMNGYKMDLFVLELSFIGWFVLCTFTLGIGYLWLMPYYNVTLANFYLDIK